MLYCAACNVKACAKKLDAGEPEFPRGCPSTRPEVLEYSNKYRDDEIDLKMARVSAVVSPDHTECRLLKTIHFAKECGFQKVGLAFCITYKEEAAAVNRIMREHGLTVESVVCKVGHCDRSAQFDVPWTRNVMCNPIAQAEYLNAAGTELNVAMCLCVGHDSLFIRHSNAPVTVLAAKDHVYDNAPLEYLKNPIEPGTIEPRK